MQENFLPDRNLEPALLASLSAARLGRYLKDSGGNRPSALRLYDWNVRLSQGLYVRLQIWEITLRNRMNGFLSEKFGKDWPHRPVVSQLRKSDLDRLRTSVLRQKNRRGLDFPTTDMIVADLSAGFWVAMFAQRYSRMFGWPDNLQKVFPYARSHERHEIFAMNGRVLEIRNRIAHHEPIYHFDLLQLDHDLNELIRGMCQGAAAYANKACRFRFVLTQGPERAT